MMSTRFLLLLCLVACSNASQEIEEIATGPRIETLINSSGAHKICFAIPRNVPYASGSDSHDLHFRFRSTHELEESLNESSKRLAFGDSIAVVSLFASEARKNESVQRSGRSTPRFDVGNYVYFPLASSRGAQTFLYSKRKPLLIQYYLGQTYPNEAQLIAAGSAVGKFVDSMIVSCSKAKP